MLRAADNALVREEDLHAYLDGALAGERRQLVEAYLAQNPHEAERVAAYWTQNLLLHKTFDSIADEPLSVPLKELKDRLVAAAEDRPAGWRERRWFAAAACVAAVSALGWLGHDKVLALLSAHEEPRPFARLAMDAHGLLAGESLPPLAEKGAEGGNALVRWLSQRETKIAKPAPDLKQFGLELSGGRIFLLAERPVVQLVYRDKGQQKLTFYLGAAPLDDSQTLFTFAGQGDLSTLYWRQRNLEFSLVGRMNRDDLLAIAKAVQSQLGTLNAPPETASSKGKLSAVSDRGLQRATRGSATAAGEPAALP